MTRERAAAERRVDLEALRALVAACRPDKGILTYDVVALCDAIETLIAELRAAWWREDEAAIELVREQVKFEKKSLEAGYHRGLAAARAAVAKEIPACRCDAGFKDRGLTDPGCSRCEFGDDVLAVIDALLAGAEGKCIKMFNKKLETQGQ